MSGGPTLEPAQALQSDEFPPISRLTLALYCGASGDHNPLHVDVDFARAAGLDDVIAHGMLAMAYLGRFLTAHYPQSAIRRLSTRFVAMTRVGDRLTCYADPVQGQDDGATLRYTLRVVDQAGEVKLLGEAEIDDA